MSIFPLVKSPADGKAFYTESSISNFVSIVDGFLSHGSTSCNSTSPWMVEIGGLKRICEDAVPNASVLDVHARPCATLNIIM